MIRLISKNVSRILLWSALFLLCFSKGYGDESLQRNISLPSGFTIKIYTDNVQDARSMALGSNNTLFVGSRKAGKVYAVLDRDGDFTADEIITIADGLNMPNGVALHDGDLYVAESQRIIKFKNIEKNLNRPGKPEIVFNGLPDKRWHGWRYIKFGPDKKLYISIGSPCNVCEPDDKPFGTIAGMNEDGSGFGIYARGIRNSVGFDWHPDTNELWFTDNGRDFLGDDIPPDELNHAPRAGMHFGFPYLHGADISDPQFGNRADLNNFTGPARELGPHVAALGMQFYTGNMFPDTYSKQIFIAEHGSWNRSEPIGYRISLVRLKNSVPVGYEIFAEGWQQKHRTLGRPVDIEVMSDGSMLVSDDYSGRIYRIVYSDIPDLGKQK